MKLTVPNLKKHMLPVEVSVDTQKLELMVLNVVLFCFVLFPKPVTKLFVLLSGPLQNGLFCFMNRYKTLCFA